MTVGQLRELIENLDDELPVLVPARDHSLRDCTALLGTALYSEDTGWTQDFGEQHTPSGGEWGNRTDVVIVE